MHKILSILVLVTISPFVWGQSVTLSSPETFGGDESCYYIQSVALDEQNSVVLYSGSDGTKVRNVKIENGTLSYGTPVLVSYGSLSIDGVDVSSPDIEGDETEIFKKEGILDIPLKIVRNSFDSFIVFYENDKDPGANVARFGTLVNNAITLGDEFSFGDNGIVGVNGFDAISIGEGRFLIAYNNDVLESSEADNQIGVQLVSMAANDISSPLSFSAFTPFTAQGVDATDLSIAKISDTQFAVAYINRTNNSVGEYVVGTIAGNTVEFSPIQTFSDLDLSGVKAIGLGQNRLVINYGVDNSFEFSKDFGYSLLCSVSGTGVNAVLQVSDPFIFNPDGCSNYDMDGLALTDDAFILFWSNGSTANSNRFAVGKLVNSDIVFDKNVDDQLPEIAYPGVSLLSPDNLLFSYQDQASTQYLGKNVFVGTQALVPELIDELIVPDKGTPTDVEELKQSGFRIYPHVTNGIVNIEQGHEELSPEMTIKVFNMSSKLVHSEVTTNPHHTLNISDLPNGMYLVSVKVGTYLITEKIIKQ